MSLGDELRAFYAGKRVLITGHTGFKGSWLTAWLAHLGAEVIGFAQPPPTTPSAFVALGLEQSCTHLVGDIRSLESIAAAVARARPEVIFHLAAQPLVRLSYEEPLETIATNVLGTSNLLEAVRHTAEPVAIVVVTSDKCYENREWLYGYREDDALGGHDIYSMSKAAAELVAASYRRSFFSDDDRVMVATARAGNVIGGGDWAIDRIVPDAVRALSANRAIGVRNPSALRPWQHVIEPLAGYLQLGIRLRSPDGRAFAEAWNFGPRVEDSRVVSDLVDQLIGAWGGGSREHIGSSAQHEANLLRLSIEKAAARLRWRPRWTFEESVKKTVEWYRSFHAGANVERERAFHG